jgi:tetratricopeptide (TPR) repeat protein
VRAVLTIALAAWIPALAQPDPAARLESLLGEARQAQARSDFRAAATAYRKALALRPDVAELWSNLGLMQHESREYSQAADAFRSALRLNQSLFVPNLFLGLDLLQLDRPKEAVAPLLAAQQLNPGDPQPPLALGRTFHMLWDPEKSWKWYERTIALAPRSGQAWYGLGLAYFDLAEAAGARLTDSFGESVYVAELTANALAEEGRLTEAIYAYRTLLALGGTPPRCSHASFGLVLLRHGNATEAEQEFKRDQASCSAARIGMARLLYESGEREKGLAMLADLADSDPESFEVSLPRFWEGLDTPQLETRLALLRQSASVMAGVVATRIREGVRSAAVLEPERSLPEPGDLAGLAQLASSAFFSGHFRTAALASDRLRRKYPNDPSGWYWAVQANQRLGVAALARAAEVEPDSSTVHALLGDYYRRRRMFDQAREEYSKVLAISPDSPAGLAGLASTDLGDGKLEAARATAQRILNRNPADADINLLMAEILVAQHEEENAEPYLKRSLSVRPDLLPHVHALLGRVLEKKGREKEAIEELKQGLASDEDGSVYYQLARLYQRMGDPKSAEAAFEKSKQLRARRDDLARKALMPGD